MKILISADLEGVTGVNGSGFLDEESQHYKDACLLLTNEINLVIDTCFRYGASKIFVTEGHGDGNNIHPDLLDNRAVLHNKKEGKLSMMEGIEEVDFCMFVGYHGKANVPNSYCAHTNATKTVSKVLLNEIEVGEAQINALIAKFYGVKLIFISGTDYAVQEVSISNLPNVITKISKEQYLSELRPEKDVSAEIQEKVKTAILNSQIIPFIDGDPKQVEWKISVPYVFLLSRLSVEGVEIIDRQTVKIIEQDIVSGFLKYRKLLRHLSENYDRFLS